MMIEAFEPGSSAQKLEASKVSVNLSGGEPRQYNIVVRAGLLSDLGQECAQVLDADARILLLTDMNLAERYLETAKLALERAGFGVVPHIIPAGEESKSLTVAQGVYETLLQSGFTRKDAIVGLGGGVIGDLAGFCASTYHRGMQLVHVPTTLVAQVDSAIGGKTAVNFDRVKNIVGTFYQPRAVLIDPQTLNSLPPREFAAGMAEVIKYGLIETSCDGQTGFFDWLCRQAEANTLKEALPEMIQRCCAIKAAVVMQDELETKGLRFFLNLGHTFGHAYESLSHYGILHGEAVALGMLKAVRLSAALGLFSAEVEAPLRALYRYVGLDVDTLPISGFSPEDLLAKMKQDKKNRDANIRLVLPVEQPGRVVVRSDIPNEAILVVLAETYGSV